MRSAGNGEQARQTKARQADNQCNSEHDPGRLGASASQSERAWDVENEASNPTGKRRDSNRHINSKPGKTFGGILRQLIAENNDQLAEYRSKLAEYQSKIEELEHRRSQLQEFYEQLQVNAGEDEDEESSEEEVQARSEEE